MANTPPGFEDDEIPEDIPRDLGEELTVDAGTPEGVAKQRRTIKKKKFKANEILLDLLEKPEGRDFLWSILSRGKPFQAVFGVAADGSKENNITFFNQGKKHLCEGLFAEWLQIAPDKVLLLMKEHDPRFAAEVKTQG